MLVAVAGGLIAYRLTIYPWTAPPPESPERIRALWQQVTVTAGSTLEPSRPSGLPDFSLDALQGVERLVHRVDGAIPAVQEAELGPERVQVLERFLAWSAGPAGPSGDYCQLPASSPTRFLSLGQLAIARAAPSSSDPYLVAAVRLARLMRRKSTLLLSLTGIALASDVAAWAQARRVPLEGELGAMAPTRQELLSSLAREHLCLERLFRGERAPAGEPRETLSEDHREVQMLRWCLGRQFDVALTHQDQPELLAGAYHFETTDSLPKSLACRGAAQSIGVPLKRALQSIDDYGRVAATTTAP